MTAIWTCTGSTAIVDEKSLNKYESDGAWLMHKGTSTGYLLARCNVTNPMDKGASLGWNVLEVVYRYQRDDSKLNVVLSRISNKGNVSRIAEFSANSLGVSPDTQMHSKFFSHSFDFANNAYFVFIEMSRKDTEDGNRPSVAIVRLQYVVT